MAIEITGRHVDVSNRSTPHAPHTHQARQSHHMARTKLTHEHVVHDVILAEVVAHAARHIQLEAKATSENMYAAIDEAVDKVESQLRKTIDKRHDHKGNSKLRDLEGKPEEG